MIRLEVINLDQKTLFKFYHILDFEAKLLNVSLEE